MQFPNAAIWIDHELARVVKLNRENEETQIIHAIPGKEHLHHKAGTIGAGKAPPHLDYYHKIFSVIGNIPEVLVVGPAQAKHEFVIYAQQHNKEFASHVVKVETLDRITEGEFIAYARRFFHEMKPRLNSKH